MHADVVDERGQVLQAFQTCGGLIVVIWILYDLYRVSVDVSFLFSENGGKC